MLKRKKQVIWRIFLVIISLLVLIPALIYTPEFLKLTLSMENFRDYILSMGKLGPLVFIFFQIFQTVIAPIPSEVVQIAGGYIYGVPLAMLYTTVGMLIGAIIAFYFTRFVGGSLVEKLLRKNKSQWMTKMTNHKKFSIFLLIIFLIPGLPKDVFIYMAGLTPMKPLKFFIIMLVGRFPWLLASVCIGSNLYQKDYTSTIMISVISLLAFIFGMIYKDKIILKLSQLKTKSV